METFRIDGQWLQVMPINLPDGSAWHYATGLALLCYSSSVDVVVCS